MNQPTSAVIACSEVWGNNRATATELELPGLHGWVFARPYHGQDAGGDVHYVSSCGTGRIARVLLADVAGHGDEAATMGCKLRRLMQRYMNHIQPHALAAQMNRDMGEVVGGTSRFVTAVVITFFSPDGGLSLCNAGHPPPMLYRQAKRAWSPIDQPDTQGEIANLPLGVLESSGYQGRELTLEPGDIVLAYTDCLVEARPEKPNTAGNRPMLELAGLLSVLNELAAEQTPSASPRQVVEQLLARLDSAGYDLDDDLTAVALQCSGRCAGRGLRGRAMGMWRMMQMSAGALAGRSPVPMPELSVANLWGAVCPWFKRKPRN